MAQLGIEQHRSLPEVKAEVLDNPVVHDPNGTATFRMIVEIPPDHHGYLDRGDEGFLIPFSFSLPLLEARGSQLTILSQPSGTRDENAHATVLRNTGMFTFRLTTPGPPPPMNEPVSGSLRYQICNDRTNVCYPPRERDVPLHFVSITGLAPSPPVQPSDLSATAPLTIGERLTILFQRYMRHSILAFVLVFATGLLASTTPCVYPVLPITSAILLARGGSSRQRSMLHALVYFAGIIFFYAMVGLLAATTGTALSALMTSAWVNLGFAVIFTYFGLSMLGLYEFQFLPGLTAQLDTTISRRGYRLGTPLPPHGNI
jgi:thiol:disulfide interchange protein DsbD